MADVKCPNCGTLNPAGQEFCRKCQSPLATDAPSFQPGQLPTKKNTAELEPILPQWLRDARDQARKSAQDDMDEALTPAPDKKEPSVDLLAGLQAQAGDDDEDVPDWLSNITGKPARGKKASDETPSVRWVELGGGTSELEEPASRKKDSIPVGQAPVPTSGDNELPPWLANVLSGQQEPKQKTTPGFIEDNRKADAQEPESPPSDQPLPDFKSPFEERASSERKSTPSIENSPAVRRPEGFAPLEAGLPDWLKTGPLGQARKGQPAPQEPASEELPDWLKNLDGKPSPFEVEDPDQRAAHAGRESVPPPDSSSPFTGGASAEAQTPDWLAGLGTDAPAAEVSSTPDWLKGMGAGEPASPIQESAGQDVNAPLADTPDWLKDLGSREAAASPEPSGAGSFGETPDWLKSFGTEEPSAPPAAEQGEGPAPLSFGDTPDWLKDLGAQEEPSAPAAQTGASSSMSSGDSPDWLKDLGSQEPAASAVEPAESGSLPFGDSPDWLKDLGAPEAASGEASSALPFGDSPDWLKSLGADQSEISESPAAEPGGEDLSSESPDWLKDLGSIPSPDAPGRGSSSAFATTGELHSSTPAFPSSSAQNAFEEDAMSKGDMDSLFHAEMPDWLAGVAAEESAPAAGSDSNVIAPGSLPSWVEAMRPVESSVAQGGTASDRTLESRGPLAGLQGVLPAVPFLGPSVKPRAYSIKLTAGEEQQAHAAILEEVLAAETVPVPIITQKQIPAQYWLRLVTAALLLLLIAGVVFSGTQFMPTPAGVNNDEEILLWLTTMGSMPADAPMLVVFDYDPARSAELETLAGPLVDQIILIKHPRLAFLSTSPVGPSLADQFITTLNKQVGREDFQAGVNYINLGYLPGGPSGVRAFAQGPATAIPLAFDGSRPWQSGVLNDVQAFQQFAAVIVLTDSVENGRTWIEQAGSLRGAAPLVMAASAQAGPLLEPYYKSGQINFLWTGLHDAALLEQVDAGRPGTARRYWDAYNVGLLFAVVFIVGGSLFSLVMSIRERAVEAEMEAGE